MDMTEGITARFRTMAISRGAVLAGHVLGNALQGLIAVALVLGVGLLVGFRPTAGPVEWIAAIGVFALISFAVNWLGVAMGMQAKSVETASNLPLLITVLPMLGSGFVPTASMPAGLQWFAEYQPFTPVIETIRGLLLGTPLGWTPLIAVAWCVAITIIGYVWSMVDLRAQVGARVVDAPTEEPRRDQRTMRISARFSHSGSILRAPSAMKPLRR